MCVCKLVCERNVCDVCDKVACERVVCAKKLRVKELCVEICVFKFVCESVLCESVLCERVVGDAEAADRRRRDPTTEKQELHTMMWGITYLETNRIQQVIKQCVVICYYLFPSKIQI